MPDRIPNDPHTRRFYKAEDFLKSEAAEMTLAECRSFVRRIMRSDYVSINHGFRTPLIIGDGRGWIAARATFDEFDRPVIQLPRWARNKYVILHEVAHHLVMRFDEEMTNHKGLFIDVLLDLVRLELGERAYIKLRLSLFFHRVRLRH